WRCRRGSTRRAGPPRATRLTEAAASQCRAVTCGQMAVGRAPGCTLDSNDARPHRQGKRMTSPPFHPPETTPLTRVSTVTTPAAPPPLTSITPARLADLMLAAPVARRAGLAVLDPDDDTSAVSILRGAMTIAEFRVPADIGSAAAARLAVIAGLDPLADVHQLPGSGNMGRVTVRAAADFSEVLVTVGA